jgi:hypothetical protein
MENQSSETLFDATKCKTHGRIAEKYNCLDTNDNYVQMYRDNGEDYYRIRGLTFYTEAPEGLNEKYLRKIYEYAKTLQDDNFKIHYVECAKPKINKEHVFALVLYRWLI